MLSRTLDRKFVTSLSFYGFSGRPPRENVNRVHSDTVTGETVLLRAVIEEAESEIAVITLYETSKLKKYLPKETT